MLTMDALAIITWGFTKTFHLETSHGNYEWSAPAYGGDNTLKPTIPRENWLKELDAVGRRMGTYTIKEFCGDDVRFAVRS